LLGAAPKVLDLVGGLINKGGGGDKKANNDGGDAQAAQAANGGGGDDNGGKEIKGKDAENAATNVLSQMYNTFMTASSPQSVDQLAQSLVGKLGNLKLKNKDELTQYIQNYANTFKQWIQQGGVPQGAQGTALAAAQQPAGADPNAAQAAIQNAVPGTGMYAAAEAQGAQNATSPYAQYLANI
jgi:hypothetical protein